MTARPAHLTTRDAPATVTIRGTISDPSGYPLAGITIVLFADGRDHGPPLGITTTDDVGGYRFARVHTMAGAEFRVEATDESGAHVFTRSSVTIGSGIPPEHHTIMPIAAYVQGRVYAHDGTGPAQPGGRVCVTAAGENTVQTVYVSARGRFRLGGLPSGTYTVAFEDGDLADPDARRTKVTVAAGSTTTIEDQFLNHRPAS